MLYKLDIEINLIQSKDFILQDNIGITIFEYMQKQFECMKNKPKLYDFSFRINYRNNLTIDIINYFEFEEIIGQTFYSAEDSIVYMNSSLSIIFNQMIKIYQNICSINFNFSKSNETITDLKFFIYGFSYKTPTYSYNIKNCLQLDFYETIDQKFNNKSIVRFNGYSFKDWLFIYAINAISCTQQDINFFVKSIPSLELGETELQILTEETDAFCYSFEKIISRIESDIFHFSEFKKNNDNECLSRFRNFFKPFFELHKPSVKIKCIRDI